jgi:hydroxymethylbilane synthase
MLQGLHPSGTFELLPVASGEAPKDWKPGEPVPKSAGEKGGYAASVRQSLLSSKADLAVHCAKDLPIEMMPGLRIVSCTPRVDARDCLIVANSDLPTGGTRPLASLPPGTRIGTSSPRRAALLHRHAPQAVVVPMRGNVDSRLRHLLSGNCDALILAMAGLIRLRLAVPVQEAHGVGSERPLAVGAGPEQTPAVYAYPLDPTEFVPAPGQGILALEAPLNTTYGNLWAKLDHGLTSEALRVERQIAGEMDADCGTALGVHARWLGPADAGGPGWQVVVQRPVSGFLAWQTLSAISPRIGDAADQVLEELRLR